MFSAKDFIETAEGLLFAVVGQGREDDKVLCFLRYIKRDSVWKKVATEEANEFLQQYHPDFLHYSQMLDAHLHAVAIHQIVKHHQPEQRLQEIMLASERDPVEHDLYVLCDLFQQHGLDLSNTGITGSILVGVQNRNSDIDIVCYSRAVFQQCRSITCKLIGLGFLQDLNEQDWQESYLRRSCDLDFADYVWHEQRKTNKAIINGRKFDLSCSDMRGCDNTAPEPVNYKKCGAITLQCKVVDDTYAFDYPALFSIDYEQIDAIVSYTATYTGQAVNGEVVEVSGQLEQTETGLKRIVVGSSREAEGEYIKVIRA